MFGPAANNNLVKNTTHKVVVPFYVYAAISFLVACILLFSSSGVFTQHYFHPNTLAITHSMALGWGTMIVLGASHQLVPVLIEAKLFSNLLAYLSLVFAAIGIPLLVYGFYVFNMGWPSQLGGIFINIAILIYLVNLLKSIGQSKNENVHAVFVFTAAVWLLVTTVAGLMLVYNFNYNIFEKDSLHYISLHAHLGIVGWFLLLVIGVGSRLIPMFLISKYTQPKLLWMIYFLINAALVIFVLIFLFLAEASLFFIPLCMIFVSLGLFGFYCFKAYKLRIRRSVDEQMKVSLLSVAMMVLPIILLLIVIVLLLKFNSNSKFVLAYGFSIFFGWLTAIIVGMTFKTLPFIIWNKVYHHRAGLGKTPNPKDLFSNKIFKIMSIAYVTGFVLFAIGILYSSIFILQAGSILLIVAAALYNWNILEMLLHKPSVL